MRYLQSIVTFPLRNLRNAASDNGAVVNRTCASVNERSLEIMSTVPLRY